MMSYDARHLHHAAAENHDLAPLIREGKNREIIFSGIIEYIKPLLTWIFTTVISTPCNFENLTAQPFETRRRSCHSITFSI